MSDKRAHLFISNFPSCYYFIYQLTACMTTNNVKQFLVFSNTASFLLKTILERVRNFGEMVLTGKFEL